MENETLDIANLCERLRDSHIDGTQFLREEAASAIRQLEDDLKTAEWVALVESKRATKLQEKVAKLEGELRDIKMQHLDADKRRAALNKALETINSTSYEALSDENL